MTALFSKFPLTLLSALLMGAAFYSALWAVSAMHPESYACTNLAVVFAESFRCRQPYLAVSLTIVFFVASVASMYFRNRIGKTGRTETRVDI